MGTSCGIIPLHPPGGSTLTRWQHPVGAWSEFVLPGATYLIILISLILTKELKSAAELSSAYLFQSPSIKLHRSFDVYTVRPKKLHPSIFATTVKPHYKYNTNKIYIAPGILKRIRAQTHGVTRR